MSPAPGLTARIRRYLVHVPEGYPITGRQAAVIFKVTVAQAGMALWQMAKAGELTRGVPLGIYLKPKTEPPNKP